MNVQAETKERSPPPSTDKARSPRNNSSFKKVSSQDMDTQDNKQDLHMSGSVSDLSKISFEKASHSPMRNFKNTHFVSSDDL